MRTAPLSAELTSLRRGAQRRGDLRRARRAEMLLSGHSRGYFGVVCQKAYRATRDVDLDLIARPDDGDFASGRGFGRDVADRQPRRAARKSGQPSVISAQALSVLDLRYDVGQSISCMPGPLGSAL